MHQDTPLIPVFDYSQQANISRMPGWIRQSLKTSHTYKKTSQIIQQNTLHTVCEEARCPNRSECWDAGTATFMLLGDTCTRACGFCAVKTGRPTQLDTQEPQRIAAAVQAMQLQYIVLTSVNRDELHDGGASIFAQTLTLLRQQTPSIGLEVLTPDFYRCQDNAITTLYQAVFNAPWQIKPNTPRLVWGHNIETVPSLYRQVRKGSQYQRSLDLLNKAAALSNVEAKSALMLGLGESKEEVIQVFEDLFAVGVRRLTLGQYLRPTRYHLPVKEYISPVQFAQYYELAKNKGFTWVKSGPLVRSSYHAEE